MSAHSSQVPDRWHASVVAWRRGQRYPRNVEFLVSWRIEDPNRAVLGETLVERHKRLCEAGAVKKMKFPGGLCTIEDEAIEVSPQARDVFEQLGLPSVIPATLKRVFVDQTGLVLVKARPKPIHQPKVSKSIGTVRRCFFLTGPNDDQKDWTGTLNKGLFLRIRPGESDEIVEPPEWVYYEELLQAISHTNRPALRAAITNIFRRDRELFRDSVRSFSPVREQQAVVSLP